MRRRRKKNTLLPKMIGLAVVINAVLLPLLARMGAFKSVGGQRLTPVEIVKLPPPEKRPTPPKKAAAHPHPAEHKAASRPAASRRAAPGPPPVRVLGAAPVASGSGGGGDAGITTSAVPPTSPPPPPPPPPPVSPPPPPAPAPVPPPPPPPPPPVAPPLPPAAHVPIITPAAVLSQPQPTIPDELRDADLSTAFEGVFTVRPDGTAGVKMVSSTGNATLDALALEAAKRWTFRPATRDGQPVESYLRLRVEFKVSS